MSEVQDETREPFADFEKIKINILKGKILDGLDEFRKNKGQQWTELRFEEPLLVKLLSSIEQSERVQELEKKHKDYVSFTESNNYNVDIELEKLYQQNKRYREAIVEAINENGSVGDRSFMVSQILEEAMEGEE